MRRFLRTIGIGVAVAAVLLGGAEWIAESIPNSYVYKREYMEAHGGEIKTLILGSSNAYDGLNPSELPAAFNLANSSQTLEDDYRLLAKYIDGMDSLETVILGLGYHSLGEAQETHRKTYYTIYMDLYPRWPISKNSFEVFNLELLTKKIIKYAVSRDVTRCDSLGQRLGHTRAAAEEKREFWNKSAEELARLDSYEKYINQDKHADGAINIDKEEVIKNAESTVAGSNLPVITPQSACERAPRQTDDLSRDADTAELSLHDSLQKYVVPPYENDKNKGVSELVSEGISGLEEMAEMCRAHGVTMVVVQMPVMKAYKEALPKEQVMMQDSVLRAMEGRAVYIDASEWEIPADGWYNATHLTRESSAEFTKKLRDVII